MNRRKKVENWLKKLSVYDYRIFKKKYPIQYGEKYTQEILIFNLSESSMSSEICTILDTFF